MRLALLAFLACRAEDGLAVEGETERIVSAAKVASADTSGAMASESATPLAKVVTMLTDLKAKVIADGEVESKLFTEFSKWCDGETYGNKATIGNGKSKTADLMAFAEEQQALQERLGSEIDEVAGEIASTQAELDTAKGVREKEHAVYQTTEQGYIETIDQLTRAIDVLQNPTPSFVEATAVVQKAIANLMVTPSTEQQASVKSFFQQAESGQSKQASFLQQAPFKSRTGELIITLEQLRDEAKKGRADATRDETASAHGFDLLKQSLQMQIDTDTKTMNEKKNAVQKSEQAVAEAQMELQATNAVINEAIAYLEEVEGTCTAKSAEWRQRVKVRSDEVTAVTEAIEVLTSEQGQAASDLEKSKRATVQVSLVQTSARGGDQVLIGQQLLEAARAAAAAGQPDPFKNVRKMINEMIQKLLSEAAEEAEHKGWCDTEMGKSEVTKTHKTREVKTFTSKIDEMAARIEILTNEIGQLTQAVAEAQSMDAESTKIRNEEKAQAEKAVKEYQEAQDMVQRATGVLQEFYAKRAKAKEEKEGASLAQVAGAPPPKTFEGEYTGQDAGGVMSILEISLSDFARLESETKTAEQQAASEYAKMMHESQVRQAVMQKDIHYKTVEKEKLEGDTERSKTELAGVEAELTAVIQYIEKLKPSCTNQGDSHEVRKERRNKEIQGLKEALEILNNEGL
jgi:hypothetical protein